MSLVIAFVGIRGSVIAGDMREITLWGDTAGSVQFEEELYSGKIHTDDEMRKRAQILGVHLRVRDTKQKVHERDGLLIGEVTDFERGITRIRRLYVTTGRFALAEIEQHRVIRTQKGIASRFIVLGNPFTQQITNQCIQQHWKGGGMTDAMTLIKEAMIATAQKSPSVSQEHILIKTENCIDLESVIERDLKGMSGKSE